MKAHLKILRRAKRGKLPQRLDGDDAAVVLELKGLGYMDALDTTNLSGPSVLDPAITLRDAEYLKEQSKLSKVTKWALGALGGLIGAVIIAAVLKRLGLN